MSLYADTPGRPWTIERCPCETCGDPTAMTGTRRCDRCYEVERRLPAYLETKGGLAFVLKQLGSKPFAEAIRAINGLLKIARQAMPDNYFATDARVLFAKGTLRRLKGQKP